MPPFRRPFGFGAGRDCRICFRSEGQDRTFRSFFTLFALDFVCLFLSRVETGDILSGSFSDRIFLTIRPDKRITCKITWWSSFGAPRFYTETGGLESVYGRAAWNPRSDPGKQPRQRCSLPGAAAPPKTSHVISYPTTRPLDHSTRESLESLLASTCSRLSRSRLVSLLSSPSYTFAGIARERTDEPLTNGGLQLAGFGDGPYPYLGSQRLKQEFPLLH